MSNIAMGIKQAMLSKGVRQKFVAERAGFTSHRAIHDDPLFIQRYQWFADTLTTTAKCGTTFSQTILTQL